MEILTLKLLDVGVEMRIFYLNKPLQVLMVQQFYSYRIENETLWVQRKSSEGN